MSDGLPTMDKEVPLATAGLRQLARPGQQAVDFAFSFQKACLDEMAAAGDEALERMRTEMEIGAEFVARMACAHSMHEIAAAFSDCGGHRADALRRDSERMLRHGQRICERAAQLWPTTTRS